MLSAQTTDTNVNRVTGPLFQKYRKPEDYLAVPQEELERGIYATGFFRQKAKAIRGTMRVLLEEFDGEVPGRLEDLLRLPGVARKTANVVAAELGHAQGIVVDTHVRRLSQRLGLTRQEDPVKIERDLQRIVPRADWARWLDPEVEDPGQDLLVPAVTGALAAWPVGAAVGNVRNDGPELVEPLAPELPPTLF